MKFHNLQVIALVIIRRTHKAHRTDRGAKNPTGLKLTDFIRYGSARKSYLEMLDSIHHQGLRLALGAFSTSPSESLLAEANEPSLYNRRLKLSMQYALKLKSNPSNPTYETVFEPQYKTLLENKPNMIPSFVIPSFGIRISSEFESMNLNLDNIADSKS